MHYNETVTGNGVKCLQFLSCYEFQCISKKKMNFYLDDVEWSDRLTCDTVVAGN